MVSSAVFLVRHMCTLLCFDLNSVLPLSAISALFAPRNFTSAQVPVLPWSELLMRHAIASESGSALMSRSKAITEPGGSHEASQYDASSTSYVHGEDGLGRRAKLAATCSRYSWSSSNSSPSSSLPGSSPVIARPRQQDQFPHPLDAALQPVSSALGQLKGFTPQGAMGSPEWSVRGLVMTLMACTTTASLLLATGLDVLSSRRWSWWFWGALRAL